MAYRVRLIDRGDNVNAVNEMEVKHGGDPATATPYVWGRWKEQYAKSVVSNLTAVGADAELEGE